MIEVKVKKTLAAVWLRGMSQRLWSENERAVLKALQIIAGEIRRQIRAFLSASKGRRRTGTLMRSFQPVVFLRASMKLEAGVLSDLVYANVQDKGGVIRPSKAQNLAIPISRKVPLGMGPRDFGNQLFPIKSKTGTILLVRKKGKNGIEPLFVLKKSVRITAKDYIGKAARVVEPKVQALFRDAVKTTIDRKGP